MKFELPPILGSGEIEAVEVWGGCPGGRPEYTIEGTRITITMPEGTPLERVKPPLPPEPCCGYYLAHDSDQALVAQHQEGYGGQGWTLAGWVDQFTWEQIQRRWPSLTFTRLMLDPMDGAPGLPLHIPCSEAGSDVTDLTINSFDGDDFGISLAGVGTAYINPASAILAGAALLRAGTQEANRR